MESPQVIELNSYIIIQRAGYFKLHQLTKNACAMLGKDKVNLGGVAGKVYWTMFRMIPSKGKKREFDLVECSKTDNATQEIFKAVSYGTDNRNITDDGSSQALSTDDINGMRESGLSGQVILEKIIENSKTFKEKTEYSQEKYLKKKEKKYFEYVVVRKPTLRLLADIFYSRDQQKIMGLRHDTLSQILIAANIQHDGVYALFENGSQALVAAGILNYLSEKGLLINLTLGSNPQKQAVLAMNYKKDKLNQLVNAKMKNVIYTINPSKKTFSKVNCIIKAKDDEISEQDSLPHSKKNKSEENENCNDSILLTTQVNDPEVELTCDSCSIHDQSKIRSAEKFISSEIRDKYSSSSEIDGTQNKRKFSIEENLPLKKPRWEEDFERAIEAITSRKLNGIIIIAKEYPLNVIEELLPFLKPSCQLVVYCCFREPLVQLYIEFKKRKDIIGIHLTENWLRMYQVLPDRTHPDVNMSFSGHLLIATKVL